MVPIHKSRRITPRLFSQSHFDRLVDLISDQAEKIVFGGQLDRESLYIASIIMDQVDWSNKVMLGEIFGPILPILSYVQIETAIDRINQVTNPLCLSIFTRNRQLAQSVIRSVPLVVVVSTMSPIIDCPLVTLAIVVSAVITIGTSSEEFSHQKPITNRGGWLDMPIRHPPFDRPYSWP